MGTSKGYQVHFRFLATAMNQISTCQETHVKPSPTFSNLHQHGLTTKRHCAAVKPQNICLYIFINELCGSQSCQQNQVNSDVWVPTVALGAGGV